MTEKSLARWRFEIKTIGKKHWGAFFENFLGTPISNFPRLYKSINLYGEWAIFEAIIATSNQTINGDPLNYVLKVAQALWKEAQIESEKVAEGEKEIARAIEESLKINQALKKKLDKARK